MKNLPANRASIKSCRLPRAKNKGYTLIELLLVIVIIGTLAFASIGFVYQYNNNLKVTRTAHQVSQWLQAAQKFYFDNNRWPNPKELEVNSELVKGLDKKNPWAQPFTMQATKKLFQVTTRVPSSAIAKRVEAEIPFASTNGNEVTGYIYQPYAPLKNLPPMRLMDVYVVRFDATSPGTRLLYELREQHPKCLPGEEEAFSIYLKSAKWYNAAAWCIPNRLELTPRKDKWAFEVYFYFHLFGLCLGQAVQGEAVVQTFCCKTGDKCVDGHFDMADNVHIGDTPISQAPKLKDKIDFYQTQCKVLQGDIAQLQGKLLSYSKGGEPYYKAKDGYAYLVRCAKDKKGLNITGSTQNGDFLGKDCRVYQGTVYKNEKTDLDNQVDVLRKEICGPPAGDDDVPINVFLKQFGFSCQVDPPC